MFGNLRAYKVGGLDYLLMFVLAAFGLLMTALCVAGQVTVIKQERRLRQRAGDADLNADVRALGSGSRASLTIPGRPKSKQADESVVLGLRPLGNRDARRLLLRRRIASGSVAAVIACGLVTLLAVQQLGLLNAPPSERDVTLPYVASAGWDSDVTVFYDNDGAAALLEDYAGPDSQGRIHGVRDLVIDRAKAPAGAADTPSANVTVARIGTLIPDAIVAGFRAFRLRYRQDGDAVTELAGLPTGWTGVYTTSSGTYPSGRAMVMGAAHGTVVVLSINDVYTNTKYDSARYTEAQLGSWIRSLAGVLDRTGLNHVEQDTVRPAHG